MTIELKCQVTFGVSSLVQLPADKKISKMVSPKTDAKLLPLPHPWISRPF